MDIQGVRARSEAEIRRVFGIEAPAPYEPSLLESGRREVELVYLRDGYNNARVSVTSLVDTERAQVHLSLTVDEERQQVLEAVAVTGADITTSRTIARALDLTLGEPADLSDAYRAQKRLYDTGVFQRAAIALEPIGGAMAVSYSYRFKRAHVFQPTAGGAVLSGFDVQVDVARLTGTWAWDTRDDPFDAHTGWFHSSGVEYAAAAMGSDLRFVKYVLQQYYFKPVAPDAVLASAFRLGTARGFAQDLIPSERFFVGGATSVRGFAEDGVGDTSFFGRPLGGNGSLTFNQEIRFPVYRWVRGVGFVDAGNVFSRVSELSLFDLQVGTGVGLRINTPFGLARIDFGMPLTSRSREPFGRWYFSIGQAF